MDLDSMTIIHLIAQLRFGAGRYVVDTAIEQARGLKHDVIVCVCTDADEYWRTDPKLVSELDYHGIRVQTMGDFFHRKADPIHQSGARLKELKKDSRGAFVVHAHTAMAAAAGYWAQPDALIATCHGWGANRPAEMDLEDSLAYQLCDSVITYSNHWADRLKEDLAVRHPQVVLMGLDLDRYPQVPERNLPESTPVRIVTACELTPRKGVDLLLNAMPVLWKQMPDAELHIMGDGDATDRLRLQATRIDPRMGRICFHGTVPNPFDRLAAFDLFVLASRSDNLPVILLEAMLARLPIVATAVGGVPELISAAECGTVVVPESTEALAEGMIAAVKAGRQAMITGGMKGERFVRDRLDVRKTALEQDSVYREALQKRLRLVGIDQV
jgi:glycosyltransferase involved in cell wall biosynthesis